MDFWNEVAASVLSAITAAGVLAGFLGYLLKKGLEAKLVILTGQHQAGVTAALNQQTEKLKAELNAEVGRRLEDHKTSLAQATHRQNTVFSRIDQQRSDALQKIGGQISSFRWELMDFRPKTSLGSPYADDPGKDAVIWCVELMASTKEPLKLAFAHSLLLPARLPVEVGVWHVTMNTLTGELLQRIIECVHGDAFNSISDPGLQRNLLRQVKDEWGQYREEQVTAATNMIINRLRLLFDSVGLPLLGEDTLPTPAPENTDNVH